MSGGWTGRGGAAPEEPKEEEKEEEENEEEEHEEGGGRKGGREDGGRVDDAEEGGSEDELTGRVAHDTEISPGILGKSKEIRKPENAKDLPLDVWDAQFVDKLTIALSVSLHPNRITSLVQHQQHL